MSNEPKTLSFVYKEVRDKPSIPATGAWGGPTPDGSAVVVHLYVEYGAVPSVMTFDVEAGGRVDLNKGEAVTRGDATREVLATLVLAPENAASIGQFLIDKAALAAQTRGRAVGDSDQSSKKRG